MGALIILLILGIWCALFYNAGFYASFAIQRKWVRQLIGAVSVIGITTLVLWDEVKGAREFDRLCLSARTFQISPQDEGRKFEVQFMRSKKTPLQGYWRPVEEHLDTYTEVASGKVIATGKGYTAKGGWLVRALGRNPLNGSDGALIGRSFCYPSKHEDQVRRLRAMINIDV
ncbi:MAG: hypothetical protein WB821_05530 [Burkholderiaceae bacterium]